MARLSSDARWFLERIAREGPISSSPSKSGRDPVWLGRLREAGLIERLNRLNPGPAVWEITAEGRAAIS